MSLKVISDTTVEQLSDLTSAARTILKRWEWWTYNLLTSQWLSQRTKLGFPPWSCNKIGSWGRGQWWRWRQGANEKDHLPDGLPEHGSLSCQPSLPLHWLLSDLEERRHLEGRHVSYRKRTSRVYLVFRFFFICHKHIIELCSWWRNLNMTTWIIFTKM